LIPLMRSRSQRDTWSSSDQPQSAAVRTCRHWPWLALLCVTLSLAVGCGGPNVSSTKADSFQSGGLGLTLAEWERRYNLSPMETPVPWAQHVRYAERNYELTLWYDGSPNQDVRDALIYVISFRPQSTDTEKRLIEARAFLPADAQLREMKERVGVSAELGGRFAVYDSKSLGTRYPALASVPDPWEGKTPGTIYINYDAAMVPDVSVVAGVTDLPPLPVPTEPPPTNTPFILLPTPLPTEPKPPLPMPSGVPTEPLPPLSEQDLTAQPIPLTAQPVP